jgi:hypothetical protein
VEEGLGEVSAKIRAAARGSLWMLNSARGDIWGVVSMSSFPFLSPPSRSFCSQSARVSCTTTPLITSPHKAERVRKKYKQHTHIPRHINRTTHIHNLLDPRKRLDILRSSQSEIRQWSNSHDRHTASLVLRERLQYLLVCWESRWCECCMLVVCAFELAGRGDGGGGESIDRFA